MRVPERILRWQSHDPPSAVISLLELMAPMKRDWGFTHRKIAVVPCATLSVDGLDERQLTTTFIYTVS